MKTHTNQLHARSLPLSAVAAACLAIALLAGACGDDGDPQTLVDSRDSTGDADSAVLGDTGIADTGVTQTATTDTGTTPTDTGAADSTPTDTGTTDTGTGPKRYGGGVLLSEVDSNFLNLAVVAARFTDIVGATPPLATYGPCEVSLTDPNNVPSDFGYDAGTITVSGTTNPASVTLSPQAEGDAGTGYGSSLVDDHENILPGAGAIVRVDGAGGADIGAFNMVFQVPARIGVTAPSTGLGSDLSTGSDLTVTWSTATGPAQGDQVLVSISPLNGSGAPVAGRTLICAGADTGSLTIPAAALADVRGMSSSKLSAFGATRSKAASATASNGIVEGSVTVSTGGPVNLVP